jgi:hypothetical protein
VEAAHSDRYVVTVYGPQHALESHRTTAHDTSSIGPGVLGAATSGVLAVWNEASDVSPSTVHPA